MNNTVYLHVGNSYTTIKCERLTYISILKKELSFRPLGYNYSEKFKQGIWDGYIQFVRGNKFMTGLLPLATAVCASNKFRFEIIDLRKDPLKQVNPIKLNGATLRDDQYDAVAEVVANKRGVLDAATNAGKTYTACGVFQALGLKTLFLTHRSELFTQTDESFESLLGISVGHIWKDENDYDHKLTIGMVPTIARRLEHPQDTLAGLKTRLGKAKVAMSKARRTMNPKKIATAEKSITMATTSIKNLEANMKTAVKDWEKLCAYLSTIQVVIVDEAHHISADSYEDIILLCENAYYRVGLTGTAKMPDPIKNLKMKGLLGESIYTITNKELIDLGVSSKPTINFLVCRERVVAPDYTLAYKRGIMLNSERSDLIAEVCIKKMRDDKPVLILINQTSHGNFIHEHLLGKGFKNEDIAFIHGNSAEAHRKEKLDQFREGKLPILISSLILQEGVSVKSIGALIFALGGKSNVRVLQIAGRALRLNAYGNTVEIYDFLDYGNSYLMEHSKERYKIYKKSFGIEAFAEGSPVL